MRKQSQIDVSTNKIIYMRKILYCIRHGTALHNKLFWTMGRKAYTHYHDTPLLEKGWREAEG